MHEGHFVEEIVSAILKASRDFPEGRVRKVTVRVGEMLHLMPESVKLHFETVARGTPLEGAALDLVEVPVRVKCHTCEGEEALEDHHLLLCPRCGSPNVRITAGNQVLVDAVELEAPGT
jgi:hydrogenase nickel incorporation protein HypA/HybF